MAEYGTFTDPLGSLNEILGDSVMSVASGETYAPANRPQDIRYTIPDRGTDNHGVQENSPSVAYLPDQVSGNPELPTFDGPVYEEVVPVTPVAVYEVPNPQSSIRKWSQFNTIYTGLEVYAGTVGVPDPALAYSLAADQDRVRLTLRGARSVNATVAAQFAFAVSPNNDFSSYIVFGYPVAGMAPDNVILENVKDSLYVTIVPLLAYSAANANISSLSMIQEYAKPVDHNPYKSD